MCKTRCYCNIRAFAINNNDCQWRPGAANMTKNGQNWLSFIPITPNIHDFYLEVLC